MNHHTRVERERSGGRMTGKTKAPAEVLQDQGRGGDDCVSCTDESTSRKPKRKLRSVWLEKGRYLHRVGANGSTIFDTWKWIGEPVPRRGA